MDSQGGRISYRENENSVEGEEQAGEKERGDFALGVLKMLEANLSQELAQARVSPGGWRRARTLSAFNPACRTPFPGAALHAARGR